MYRCAGYGFYYNKEVWAEHGYEEPATWDEFIALGEQMKEDGLTPLAIGVRKHVWKTGDMFDYFNFRINGGEWYSGLLALERSYNSKEVMKVLEVWKDLIDRDFFNDDFAALNRIEAYAKVVQGEAGMFLGGDYEIQVFENPDDAGIFQFPVINPDIPIYEIVHYEVAFVPTNSSNPEGGKKLLAFIASQEAQEIIGQIRTPINVNVPKELYSTELKGEMVDYVSRAAGTFNFYDRDTYPPMYEKGYEAFVNFMINPENYKQILKDLDAYRERYAKEIAEQ